MKLEDICVSFENAKKLKKIGIKQESLFVWNEKTEFKLDGILEEKTTFINLKFYKDAMISKNTFYSAFTASELLNILGAATWKNLLLYGIPSILNEHRDFVLESSSLPDALSKILIHLIETKLSSVEEINDRI